MHRVQRRLATAGVLIAALLAAPPAEAFSAPDVFLKEAAASNQPMGNWIALAGASMHSVNRYEVGVRVQDTGQPGNQQRFLVQVNAVPGGAPPNQPDVYSICPIVTGAAGQIVDLQEDVRYQGDGPYSITVTVASSERRLLSRVHGRAEYDGFFHRFGSHHASVPRAYGDLKSDPRPVRRARGLPRGRLRG